MEELVKIFQQYGVYIGLPVIIAYLVQTLKNQFSFFKGTVGIRLVHFLPLLLGIVGGLFLPEPTISSKIFVGGSLGCLSLFLYKFLTVTIASKAVLIEKSALKNTKSNAVSNDISDNLPGGDDVVLDPDDKNS
jgi:hypothetical protein